MYACGPLRGPPVFDRKLEPLARGTEWSATCDSSEVSEYLGGELYCW